MNYEDQVTKSYIENAIADAGAQIVTGTYVGDTPTVSGITTHCITLGFRPRALLIVGFGSQGECDFTNSAAFVLPGHPCMMIGGVEAVKITETGFEVKGYYKIDHWMLPCFNANEATYLYLALH